MEESIYFKVTNVDEIHYGYKYHDGLNILIEKFNDDPRASCVAGGFYFTTRDHISKYYNYGVNLRIIRLPHNDPDFKIVLDPQGDKWRANKIILCEKYSLTDLEPYIKYNLLITYDIVLIACKKGNIEILDSWYKYSDNIGYNENAIDNASANGHVNVLEWWEDSDLEMKYTNDAIDLASRNGHINVLEWWKNYKPICKFSRNSDAHTCDIWCQKLSKKLDIKYTNSAINLASANGHINVLEWWKNSGLPMKYNENAIHHAASNGHINVLEWWFCSGLELNYNKKSIVISASKNGHIAVLDWCKRKFTMDYQPICKYATYGASIYGHDNVLEWWKQLGFKLECTKSVIDKASANGYVAVLEWWKNTVKKLKYSEIAIDLASARGYIAVLEWWKNSGLELKYTNDAFGPFASINKQIEVLNWWKNSGLELKYGNQSIYYGMPYGGYSC